MADAYSRVVVTDIKIPFMSMVVLMVKWAVATIPALIILSVIGSILFGAFHRAYWGLAFADVVDVSQIFKLGYSIKGRTAVRVYGTSTVSWTVQAEADNGQWHHASRAGLLFEPLLFFSLLPQLLRSWTAPPPPRFSEP